MVWRNLGVGAYNHDHDPESASAAYERALSVAPGDARLLFESDQLLKRIGAPADLRLRRLEELPDPLTARDDLAVECAHLLVTADRPVEALAVLEGGGSSPGRAVKARCCGLGSGPSFPWQRLPAVG